jgi:Putative prokaryotic signal transducing protein
MSRPETGSSGAGGALGERRTCWHDTCCPDLHRPDARPLNCREGRALQIIAITNDLVRLSFLRALLEDAGIASLLLDAHTSAIEGSIGAIPRRLVVAAEDAARARRVLAEAGEL